MVRGFGSSNRVTVTIDSRDELSGDVDRILNRVTNSIGRAGINAGVTGGIVSNVLRGIGDAARGALDSIGSALTASADLQTQAISAANALSAVSNLSFAEAEETVKSLQVEMAEAAIRLPGQVKDYVDIQSSILDDVANILSSSNGGKLPEDEFKSFMTDISTTVGALGVMGEAAVAVSQKGIQAALSGRSIKELEKLQFFRTNQPGLTRKFQEEAKRLGKEYDDLTDVERLKVIRDSLKGSLTEEALTKYRSTARGAIESFQGSLFDPIAGLFGLSRDLDKTTKNIDDSVFKAAEQVIIELIGAGGLFDSIGSLMKTLGIAGDPLVPVRNAVLGFADFINSLGDAIDNLTVFARMNSLDSVKELASKFSLNEVGSGLASTINGIYSQIISSLGSVNFDNFVQSISDMVGVAIDGIASFINNIDGFQMGFAIPVIAAKIGGALVKIFGDNIDNLANLLISVTKLAFATAAGLIVGVITNIPLFTFTAFKELFLEPTLADLENAFTFISKTFSNIFGSIVTFVKTFNNKYLQPIGQALDSIGQAVVDYFVNIVTPIKAAINNAWGWVTGAVSKVFDPLVNFFTNLGNTIKSKLDAIKLPEFQTPNWMKNPFWQNKATGHDPGGLMSTVKREVAVSGASPVIANTSETILTKEQAGQVQSAVQSKGSSGNTIAPVFNIYQQPSEDSETLARRVMALFTSEFDEWQSGYIA